MMPPKKPSGAANRKAAKLRQAAERQAAAARPDVPPQPVFAPCSGPLRAHLYQLERLTYYQNQIDNDPGMLMPDKARMSVQIAQAMGKIKVEAELQAQVDLLERELNDARDKLQIARDDLARRRPGTLSATKESNA